MPQRTPRVRGRGHHCRASLPRALPPLRGIELDAELPTPQRSPSLTLPRSAPRRDARPPWPAGRARCHRVLAAPCPHGHSHVHHRLCLVVLHLARTLAQAIGHRSTAVGKLPPPAVVQATGVRGQATSGLLGASCGHLRVRVDSPVLPRPSDADGMASSGRSSDPRRSSAPNSRQGPRATIRRKSRA